jgi:hypothetical protein
MLRWPEIIGVEILDPGDQVFRGKNHRYYLSDGISMTTENDDHRHKERRRNSVGCAATSTVPTPDEVAKVTFELFCRRPLKTSTLRQTNLRAMYPERSTIASGKTSSVNPRQSTGQ